MKIQTKLVIPLGIMFFIFASILHFYWVPKQYVSTQYAFVNQMNKEFFVLENDLTRSLLTRDVSALYSSLNGYIKANKINIINLTLIDADNKRLYPLFKKTKEMTGKAHAFTINHDLLLEGIRLATLSLDVTWNEEYLETQKRMSELELLLLGNMLFLITVIIFWQKKVIQWPIKNLEYAIDRMGKGNMSIHLFTESNDEIGDLVNNFIKMRVMIIKEHKKLKQAQLTSKTSMDIIEEKNILLQKEIARRKIIQTKLDDIAKHDELTQLPNRLLLKIEAEKALAKAKRFGHQVGFFFVDLDGFKAVNDNHKMGDKVLIEVSRRLILAVRDIDTVARFGGDEFVIMLPNCQIQQDIILIAQRVLVAISDSMESISIKECISGSLGISVYPENGTTFNELVLLADRAMYQAKKEGKNQFFMASGLEDSSSVK